MFEFYKDFKLELNNNIHGLVVNMKSFKFDRFTDCFIRNAFPNRAYKFEHEFGRHS